LHYAGWMFEAHSSAREQNNAPSTGSTPGLVRQHIIFGSGGSGSLRGLPGARRCEPQGCLARLFHENSAKARSGGALPGPRPVQVSHACGQPGEITASARPPRAHPGLARRRVRSGCERQLARGVRTVQRAMREQSMSAIQSVYVAPCCTEQRRCSTSRTA
jgi:hypothetical protein